MAHLVNAVVASLALMIAGYHHSAQASTSVSSHKPTSDFVSSNGVRLHYLDFGGTGPTLIFLAGMGDTGHIFEDLALQFTTQFHVLAITRRGYGESEKPSSGYDTDTLVADLKGFMDALGIKRASFVGHSIAGGEMTRLAGLYPARVDRLVYLDAAYNRELLPKLIEDDPAGEPQPSPEDVKSFASFEAWYMRTMGFWSPSLATNLRAIYQGPDGSLRPSTPRSVGEAVMNGMIAFRPDYRAVKAPALAFYAIENRPDLETNADPALRAKAQTYIDKVYAPWQRSEAQRFLREVSCSQVVLIPGAHHYLFVQQQSKVAVEALSFLTDDNPCRPLSGSNGSVPSD